MKFVQDRPGENYHTDDAARIYFRRSESQAPTHLPCAGMGFMLSAHSGDRNLEVAPFELIGVGRFGGARPSGGLCDSTKWTGASHEYGVYKYRRALLILESHGGGEQGYLDETCHAIELFDHMCATLPPERIWDICYLIAHTQNQAYRKGRHELTTLFLQGRLKRKRRNQEYHLEILPESVPGANHLSQAVNGGR
jgi:hypothetical protein